MGDVVLLVLLVVQLVITAVLVHHLLYRDRPTIKLEEVVREFNAQRRDSVRVPVAVGSIPVPKLAVVTHKCEIRAYVYDDGQAITMHTNPSCSEFDAGTADPENKYRGAFGRSLRPGVGLKETRGGAHTWEVRT